MSFPTKLSQLCMPSKVYLGISSLSVILTAMQNIGNNSRYAIGMFSCPVPNCLLVFLVKVIYVLFWTWVINLMCKDGHSNIAWALVAMPFILMFISIGLMMMVYQRKTNKKKCADCE